MKASRTSRMAVTNMLYSGLECPGYSEYGKGAGVQLPPQLEIVSGSLFPVSCLLSPGGSEGGYSVSSILL